MPKNRTNERRAEIERLTIPDKKIDGGVRRAFIDVKAVKENAMTIYWALKRYEDTGLTPEQIRELKERDTAKMCKQSIFDHDSITCVCGSDMDKDVEFMFCPWCGQRLKKWED